jgi:hypothetical protein
MSDGATQELDELRKLMGSLAQLIETAQRLPPGPERAAALAQIRLFQLRMAALLPEGRGDADSTL